MTDIRVILAALISLAGLPIFFSRIKQYKEKQRALARCKKEGIALQTLDETSFPLLSFTLIFAAACYLLYRNLSNIEAVCVWIVVIEIALSEIINTMTMKKNYYGREKFVYYRHIFSYDDIKELSVVRPKLLPTETYVVEITGNKIFNVSRRFFKVLQEKTGLVPKEN